MSRPPNPLRANYSEAVKRCYNPTEARLRFSEYDTYRAQWTHAIWEWKYGGNPKGYETLTRLAWKTGWEINEGGKYARCLDFNERHQRLYLGQGLIEYLKILCDEVDAMYGGKEEAVGA